MNRSVKDFDKEPIPETEAGIPLTNVIMCFVPFSAVTKMVSLSNFFKVVSGTFASFVVSSFFALALVVAFAAAFALAIARFLAYISAVRGSGFDESVGRKAARIFVSSIVGTSFSPLSL